MRQFLSAIVILVLVNVGLPALAQQPPLDLHADRGPGIATSLFGTYIQEGELLVYPFYEYTKTTGFEYKASELGYQGTQDYLGKLVEHEYLLFLAYGFTQNVAVELEGALYTSATFDKAANDPTAVPGRIEESGLGDIEAQVRWRFRNETASRPELFTFSEVVFPFQKDRVLIGTSEWEFAQGIGAIKGYSWGTLYGRVALAWDGEDKKIDLGEFAIEYLKKLSPQWRVVAAIEGESDEISLIGEAQWRMSDHAFLKLNSGFGLTEKAPDIAPEVGVMISF